MLQWQIDSTYGASPYLYPGVIPAEVIGKSNFSRMFYDLRHSSRNPLFIPNDSIFNYRDSVAGLLYDVSVSAMHLNYDRMLPWALDSLWVYFDTVKNKFTLMPDTLWFDKSNNLYHYTENPDSVGKLSFSSYQVFAGSLTTTAIYKAGTQFSITFGLPRSLFFENINNTITYLEMDFDNGQGFVAVDFDSPVIVTYGNAGSWESYQRILRLRIHYGQDIVETRMPLIIVPNALIPDDVFYASSLPFTCNINTNGWIPKEAKISVKYGNPLNKLLKPALFIEGFEHANKPYGRLTFESVASGYIYNDNGERIFMEAQLMRNAFDSLLSLGYDIVYLDLRNSQDFIQANALNAVKMI